MLKLETGVLCGVVATRALVPTYNYQAPAYLNPRCFLITRLAES